MRTSTCDLCDAYGDQLRVVAPGFWHFGGKRSFHGRAVTLRCPEDNSRLKELVGTPGNGQVIVVDGGGSLRRALLGDMLAQLALRNGWAGVIVDGAVRDSAVLSTLDLGVMALGTMPRRSNKNGEGQIGIPIEIGGVICAPGDAVFADEDGIVIIEPSRLAPEDQGGGIVAVSTSS